MSWISIRRIRKFDGFDNTVAVRADLRSLANAIAALPELAGKADADWLPWCTQQRARYMVEESEKLSSGEMNVYNLTQRISAWATGSVVIPASSGYAEETFSRFFRPGENTRFFNGAALGSMGPLLHSRLWTWLVKQVLKNLDVFLVPI